PVMCRRTAWDELIAVAANEDSQTDDAVLARSIVSRTARLSGTSYTDTVQRCRALASASADAVAVDNVDDLVQAALTTLVNENRQTHDPVPGSARPRTIARRSEGNG